MTLLLPTEFRRSECRIQNEEMGALAPRVFRILHSEFAILIFAIPRPGGVHLSVSALRSEPAPRRSKSRPAPPAAPAGAHECARATLRTCRAGGGRARALPPRQIRRPARS